MVAMVQEYTARHPPVPQPLIAQFLIMLPAEAPEHTNLMGVAEEMVQVFTVEYLVL
jgi:hypothetical protein